MRRPVRIALVLVLLLVSVSPCRGGFLDDLSGEFLRPARQASFLDDTTIVRGLKEALATGTERAVATVAKPDGYFGNQLIKILVPDKLQRVAGVLETLGYREEVDELVLSMNRAAEQAAPMAATFFGDAIRQMTVEDAREILRGGDTAATAYFEKKTRARLFKAFKPVVTARMNQLGTVRAYEDLIGTYSDLPLAAIAGLPSLDLDTYVTNKALDGLFLMVGKEEKRIRTNPAARTTELLQQVFGGR